MSNYKTTLQKILSGSADANLRFSDIRNLLLALGFEERVRGSHHLFRKDGVDEKINIQRDGDKAKPYQVRQIRSVLVKYRLGGST
jgi:predicted RNA binding protein YcfA (HicA-like mRNA interferase family)